MGLLQQVSRNVMRRWAGVINLRGMVSVLPADAIPSIDSPVFISATEASRGMEPTERVLGVEINGEARAYPVNVLTVHEIVNDHVGGIPVCVTWCPLSYAGIVYLRVVADTLLSLGGSGKILRNSMVMYDRNTGSLWNQLSGVSFSGPLSGFTLQPVPSSLTTWQSWVREYPATVVLSKEDSPYGQYDEDHMTDYYSSEKTGIRNPAHSDRRLFNKEIVFGTVIEGKPVVYPVPLLKKATVIHDETEAGPVVVFWDTPSETARLYQAALNKTPLTFYEQENTILDYQTNSTWSRLTGRATGGPLKGGTLTALPATTAFWFAWADHFPNTRVYSLPTVH